jgi:hypothetical protein
MRDFEVRHDSRHALVGRIIASRQFARAPQLKDFLVFIAERALSDESAGINETEIGRVLRPNESDFDPNADNIVRVQARHLRAKLEEYFKTDGKDEAVLLTIPKGSYVPRFEPRASLAAEPLTVTPAPSEARPRIPIALVLAAVLVAGLSVLIVLVARRDTPPATVPAAATAPDAAADVLWATLARTGRKTYIVLSDSSLSVLQNLLRRQLSLAEYLAPGYPRDAVSGSRGRHSAAVLAEITRYPYTSLNSAIVGSKLHSSGKRHGVETTLRYPRDINMREFKSENFLLIGSRRAMPWVELFEDRLNFTVGTDAQEVDFYIRNRAPRPEEQPVYRLVRSSGAQSIDYAALAVLPNLGGTGVVVFIQGITALANEAAEEIISNPQTSPLHKILQQQPPGALPQIEILIRATGVAGAPATAEVVATRVRPG